jgi:hypothetical protein
MSTWADELEEFSKDMGLGLSSWQTEHLQNWAPPVSPVVLVVPRRPARRQWLEALDRIWAAVHAQSQLCNPKPLPINGHAYHQRRRNRRNR